MKYIRITLFSLNIFVAIGALVGGFAAIINPEMPLGTSAELLKGSPFDNYLIPGILLLGVLGLGNILSAITLILKSKIHWLISNVVSWALIIWVVVQCIILEMIIFAHIIFFAIGIFMAILSFILMLRTFDWRKYVQLLKGEQHESGNETGSF